MPCPYESSATPRHWQLCIAIRSDTAYSADSWRPFAGTLGWRWLAASSREANVHAGIFLRRGLDLERRDAARIVGAVLPLLGSRVVRAWCGYDATIQRTHLKFPSHLTGPRAISRTTLPRPKVSTRTSTSRTRIHASITPGLRGTTPSAPPIAPRISSVCICITVKPPHKTSLADCYARSPRAAGEISHCS